MTRDLFDEPCDRADPKAPKPAKPFVFDPSAAFGYGLNPKTLKCDGVHTGPPCPDPECRLRK